MNPKLNKSFWRVLAFCIALIGYSNLSAQQLTAAFTADTTSGCAPVVVKFTDQTTGGPTSWFWDLGNGITSTQQSPTTFYFNSGTYSIKLVVRNASGRDSIIKINYITVYSLPEVNFTANNTSGCYPLPVQFTDLSSAGSGTITSWEWDFGDGTISNQQNPVHVYNVAGSFSITLRVKNNFGCTKVFTRPSYINIQGGLKADFTFNTTPSCNPPTVVNFSNSSAGQGINSFLWSFGDGTRSTSINPSHTYANPGAYSVKLVIRNLLGCIDSLVKSNAINVGSVSANFTTPATICQGSAATFTNTSFPSPGISRWEFSDGTTLSSSDAVKIFTTPGTLTVKLVTDFGACRDSIMKSFVVAPKPTAAFSFSTPISSCGSPYNVSFIAQGSAISSYSWNFGDGTTSTTANPTHQYQNHGSYSVSLTVTGNNGCRDTVTKTNIIRYGPPKINKILGAPHRDCAPFEGTFGTDVTSSEPIASYFWDFGDGTTSTDSVLNHTYVNPGVYNITVAVTTASGCSDTFRLNAAIVLYGKPNAAFTATPLSACANDMVYFTDASTGPVTSWFWQFGDGGYSSDKNPVYHYTDTGYFNVRLIVSNNACKDTLTIPKYVYVSPPVAFYLANFNCDTPFLRKFQNMSVGGTRWKWSFGDGDTSNLQNPSHTYRSIGRYEVKLEVWNNSCYDFYADSLTIYESTPDFTVSDTALCKYSNALFKVVNVDSTQFSTYTWNWGDGNSTITNLPSLSHSYTTSGTFTPQLITRDNLGCVDTVIKQISIRIYGPNAGFSNPEGTCINGTIPFTDLSQPMFNQPIVNWFWDYGDTKSDTKAAGPFAHIYTAGGTFTVKLKILDQYGCFDSIIKPQAVIITNPKAGFVIVDSFRCTNNVVNFTDTSAGLGLVYNWNFGDGGISPSKSPTHTYASEGRYPVRLKISDRFGCTDSATNITGVLISNPQALLSVSDTFSSCPPFLVKFKNSSTSSSLILWDFDDGSFSNTDSPSHYYTIPQVYSARLIAYGYGNCSDTISQTIVLKGPYGSINYSPLQMCSPGVGSFIAQTRNNASFIWDFGDGNSVVTVDSILSHTYTLPGKYTPKMLLVDSAGCVVPITGKDTLTVADTEAGIKAFNINYCDSTTLQFFDSSFAQHDAVVSYQWKFGDGGTSGEKNPLYTYTIAGSFPVSLIVTTSIGCIDTVQSTSPVSVTESPQITITGDATLCINQPGSFAASSSQPANLLTWSWNFGNGTASTQAPPFTQHYAQAGTYFIRASAASRAGCIDSSFHKLDVHALPIVNAGADSAICLGKNLTLNPSGAASYTWMANSALNCINCTNPVATPVDSTNFIVTGTSSVGCKNTDTILVRVVKPMSIAAIARDTLCAGQSARLWASGADLYTWTPSTGLSASNIANPVANPTVSTDYMVIGQDYKSCFADTAYVPVVVYPVPVFNILQDKISLPVGTTVTLSSTSSPDIISYRWAPAVNLSCNNCPQPVASPKADVTYKATVVNGGGCTATDEVSIQVLCNNGNIFVPNTFSPNGDGSNDVFYPRGKGMTIKSVKIINRWGAIVFQNTNFSLNDPSSGWDGSHNGKPLGADVFVYEMEVVCENNQVFPVKGNLTLLK